MSIVHLASEPAADFSNCDREPIHVPGSIQPHGFLVVVGTDGAILQASENAAAAAGASWTTESLAALVGEKLANDIAAIERRELGRAEFVGVVRLGGSEFYVLAHRNAAGSIVEFERRQEQSAGDLFRLVESFTFRIESARSVGELSEWTCREIRQLTGFDRVLVYQFDPQWNGTVVGEDGNGNLPSYLHHRFPAGDIPAQARELYRVNRLRIIPDASYRPSPILPPLNSRTGKPLDLTFATLRSVAPVHLEYMRNMETAASMSVSILRAGILWGLISCHHREAKNVPFPVRETCELFARAFTLRLAAVEQLHDNDRRPEVRSAYSRLLALMADRGDFAAVLDDHPTELLAMTASEGAAVLTEGRCHPVGKAPTENQVRDLADWLFAEVQEEVFATDSLSSRHPAAEAYKEVASGLLAIAVSKIHRSYVMWFRSETVQTVKWAGEPSKATIGADLALHPRRSFETWKEIVRQKSRPWLPSEIEVAHDFRNAIVGIVLRKAEELAELNTELTRSNQELEAFSYSVSHDLRAPLRHIVGYAEILKEGGQGKFTPRDERCLATIIESSEYAGKLVDKLLGYSRLGRAELQLLDVDMNLLIKEIQGDVMRDAPGREIVWRIGALPRVVGDVMMLRMAFRDLLANAVKYTRAKNVATIDVSGCERAAEYEFAVKDNGVGFDMAYADKLFGVFQRLHKWEDYEGTGIGLANVRRVIERHGGRTWAEGKEGDGATFYVTLPKR